MCSGPDSSWITRQPLLSPIFQPGPLINRSVKSAGRKFILWNKFTIIHLTNSRLKSRIYIFALLINDTKLTCDHHHRNYNLCAHNSTITWLGRFWFTAALVSSTINRHFFGWQKSLPVAALLGSMCSNVTCWTWKLCQKAHLGPCRIIAQEPTADSRSSGLCH